jgi:hypothetical protein
MNRKPARPVGFAAAGLAALIVLSAASAAFAADAPAAKPKAQRQCFWTRNVTGFAAADENTLNVRVNVRDVYQFEMFGRCPDIDWNQRIALVSRGGSSICDGMDAEVITHSPLGPQRCQVRSVKKLTPEEIAALPKRARP